MPKFTILASEISKKTPYCLISLPKLFFILPPPPKKITYENSYVNICYVKLLLVICLEKQFIWFDQNLLNISEQGTIRGDIDEYAFWDLIVR